VQIQKNLIKLSKPKQKLRENIISNYPGRLRVLAATRPCTYLFAKHSSIVSYRIAYNVVMLRSLMRYLTG